MCVHKPIGGFIPFDFSNRCDYYEKLYKYNSARNALIELVKARNYKRVLLPKYICDSVYNVLSVNGIEFDFYHLDDNFKPVLSDKVAQDTAVLVVNYFASLSNDEIIDFNNRFEHVVLDNTQSFFMKPLENIDTIYSCRKWFGVPDGGYLNTNESMGPLERACSYQRASHILGKFDSDEDIFYEKYKIAEKQLSAEKPMFMSRLTEKMLRDVDYQVVADIRSSNFKILEKSFFEYNCLNDVVNKINNVPFMYPLLLEKKYNGDTIREQLRAHSIFLPMLWPNVCSSDVEERYKNWARNILFIPLDQRYNEEDMFYLCEVLTRIIKH